VTNDKVAREILDAGRYVVLATADADGVPWASPVWYAMDRYSELWWLSDPTALHSRNIAARARLGMVVFDSTVPPNTGQAVYMSASAEQVSDANAIERGLAVFSRKSVRHGGPEFGPHQVTGEARLRLFRADVHEHSILDPDRPADVRVTVNP
jgi:nitroimidazol reductase NimA-like FMN-containing flavoprotein (pyridoxamine 5'-phosphate oxidase superfamily)